MAKVGEKRGRDSERREGDTEKTGEGERREGDSESRGERKDVESERRDAK